MRWVGDGFAGKSCFCRYYFRGRMLSKSAARWTATVPSRSRKKTQNENKERTAALKSRGEIMRICRFWSNFEAWAPTQIGLGDTKDVTIDEAGTSGAPREVWERLFSARGGFWAALGAPRVVQERPREAKSNQKKPKSEPRWLQKWCRGRYL